MAVADFCTHEWSWECEGECEHWCWHSHEWECLQYECDCESVEGAVDDSSGAGEADLRLRDLAAIAAIGGLAYGTVRLFQKRREGKGEAADQSSQNADADSPGTVVDATPMMPSAGWYTDGASVGLRWWNGAAWTEHRQSAPTIPAGWYDDRVGSIRWWDGTGWTGHVAPMP
ncbi:MULTISPECIES: DUF2510 domain-containing protein [unclassified Microbacterium]|uniref:DUF2510 domain-containing protein n=2 Tax=unclassified Microbacterium TaxID=2609290 RepID=UPI0027B9994A